MESQGRQSPIHRGLSKRQGGVGPPSLESAPAHRRHCGWWMWKSQSWGTCLGAHLGCLHFHAVLNSWKDNESIPRGVERGSQFFLCYSFWIPRKSRTGDMRALLLDVTGSQDQGKEGGGRRRETPPLPLTQGQGRPWRGQSSRVASPGPHSQLMAAACSPCHAPSPLGSGGEGAAGPQTRVPSSC